MKKPPIVLLTDFGLEDAYVGIMKGVILNIAPDANIIDLTHNILPQNIKHGAYILKTSYKYFPEGSIFVCVIDPGVGSARRAIAIKFENYYFVAPDNGILSYLHPKDKIENAIHLNNPTYHLHNVSSTFHGRDIFAPVAAHINNGILLDELGKNISSKSLISIPKPYISINEFGGILGEVLNIDRFGNLITSIEEKHLKSNSDFKIQFGNIRINKISKTFSDAKKGEVVAYIGSSGYLEIGKRDGNLVKEENIDLNDKIKVNKLV